MAKAFSTFAVPVLVAALCSATLPAQSPARPDSSNGTQILLLGTAAGPPLHVTRSEPAALLIVDGRPYLIDCGIGTMRRLLEARVPSQGIRTIFFTHLHADHALGLADVLANDLLHMDLRAPEPVVDIYGPVQTAAFVDAAYRYVSLPYEEFVAEGGGPMGGLPQRNPFAGHEITKDGVVYQDDRIRVIAVENTHYAMLPASQSKAMTSWSYRFETPHGAVVFTGDTGPSDAVVRLAHEADLLVTEVSDFAGVEAFAQQMADENHWSPTRLQEFMMHMTREHLDLADVGALASKAHVKAVLLDHWVPTDANAYVEGVRKHFAGPIFAGADLERYCLASSTGAAATNARTPARCD